eukprot:TRINITY_DN2311_c0_g1_i3.p1 TRINITY_DN2311_c0_g1~~TRINITY_DN2311_c0_g1_i3.p1  ORF type:complete len:193 (+),score=32.91 TRINITY_DN2311_c0_g1_i3:221-799(+)
MRKNKENNQQEVGKQPSYTNYIYQKYEVPQQNEGWMILKFCLLEKGGWAYTNFQMASKAQDTLFSLKRRIVERHGKIQNIRLYKDMDKQEKIEKTENKDVKFTDTLGEIFNTKGEPNLKDAKSFTIFYEFDVNIDSPLLLYDYFSQDVVYKQPLQQQQSMSASPKLSTVITQSSPYLSESQFFKYFDQVQNY